jgi:hypothetical protein
MKGNQLFILAVAFLLSACATTNQNNWNFSSPDGKITLTVNLNESGSVYYTLLNQYRTVIGESPMGMIFEEANFDAGLSFVSETTAKNLTENYTLLHGKKMKNNPVWNEMALVFQNKQSQQIEIQFRLYDTGLAFRYHLPAGENPSLTLTQDLSGFQIPAGSQGWMHPYDSISQWTPGYETYYEYKLPVGTAAPTGKNGWAFPMLFHTGSDWMLISDADMPEGFTGMMVDGTPEGGLYTLQLPLEEEAMGVCGSNPVLGLPYNTAWRVIITGETPATIVESNLIFDVSTPNKIGDLSWIKHGRSSWSWWSESDSPRDFNRMKEFIDFTRDMGWEYFLVDANWNEMVGGNLEELTQYANSQGVDILAWYNSGGPHNVVTEQPRDLMHLRDVRRAEFEKISNWGVKGIKVDFFQSDKHCIIQQYHDILKDAADFNILINFHGSTLPRGWERTYPNLMTMESVRGAEVYKFGRDFPERSPRHNAILPFSRNVVGSMDYTPVTFSNSTYPKLTTHGHELALAVVFESGIQHFADSDKSYMSQPDYVIEYLKNVPVVWDETRFVDGYPGDYAIIARRNGDTWYLSGISGLEESMDVKVDLGFLPQGNYTVELISDGEQINEFSFDTMEVEAGQTLTVPMAARGGFAAVISAL